MRLMFWQRKKTNKLEIKKLGQEVHVYVENEPLFIGEVVQISYQNFQWMPVNGRKVIIEIYEKGANFD